MVAQGPDLPIHLGSMPDAVAAVARAFGNDVADGDVFIHNDPYFGGSHLPDVNVVTPAFHDGRLLGYACLRAHWPDVGSATPGSYGAVTEIYGEGLRLPPVRLYNRGELQRDVEAIIFANVRTPAERQGDLRAQIAANRRACQRLQALAQKHGADTLLRIMQEVMDYSDRMMRLMLSKLPDGSASFEDWCDGDGILEDGETEDRRFKVRLSITKRGDTLQVDFAGSDPQVPGPMNAPLSVTRSGVFCALKMVADPTSLIPPNSGCWRAVEVTAPEASVVNAAYPAPVVYANHEMSHRVADMVFGALAQFLPNNVMACSQGTSAILTLGGVDPRDGQRYVSYETIKGGFGARPNKDGINVVASTISNTMNTPVELLEMSFPVRVDSYEIAPDSGGIGKFRGGCGAKRSWTVLGPARASVCMERTTSAPFGLAGGGPGFAARVEVEPPGEKPQKRNGKGAFSVPAGGRVHFLTPGSGGYGDPKQRDRAAIASDLRDGYVTPEAAKRDYGVSDPEALAKTAQD